MHLNQVKASAYVVVKLTMYRNVWLSLMIALFYVSEGGVPEPSSESYVSYCSTFDPHGFIICCCELMHQPIKSFRQVCGTFLPS